MNALIQMHNLYLCILYPFILFQGMRRGGYPDKDHYRDGRGFDGKYRDHGSDRDRPFSDDFVSKLKTHHII